METHARTQGTVKWYDSTRGFGFITLAQSQVDVYVHFRAIRCASRGLPSLSAGAEVDFELADNHGSVQARDVALID
jgi:CspA family cold shock protein